MDEGLEAIRRLARQTREREEAAARAEEEGQDDRLRNSERARDLEQEIPSRLATLMEASDGLLTTEFVVLWRGAEEVPFPRGRIVEILVIPSDGLVRWAWSDGRNKRHGGEVDATDFSLDEVIKRLADDDLWQYGFPIR